MHQRNKERINNKSKQNKYESKGNRGPYFLSYNRIPWMQDAPIRSVLNVQMSGPEAIEWPDLDVDLEIDCLRHPERYPLVIKRNPLDYVGV